MLEMDMSYDNAYEMTSKTTYDELSNRMPDRTRFLSRGKLSMARLLLPIVTIVCLATFSIVVFDTATRDKMNNEAEKQGESTTTKTTQMATNRTQPSTTVGTTASTVTLAKCPVTWIAYQGSCYLFGHNNAVNFPTASHFCRQKSSHLVHISDGKENNFIKSAIAKLTETGFWIGLTDGTIEGLWLWSDTQEEGKFFDWAPGEPNNDHGNEDCVEIRATDWNDKPCSFDVNPICEMDL